MKIEDVLLRDDISVDLKNELIEYFDQKKREEMYQDISREVLRKLNDHIDCDQAIKEVVSILKSRTGFDAVGIRLKKENEEIKPNFSI